MECGSKAPIKHETSRLLTKKENEQIFQLLGPKSLDSMVAFEFANENEAALFQEKLINKLEKRKEAEENKRKTVMNSHHSISRSATPPPNLDKKNGGYLSSKELPSKFIFPGGTDRSIRSVRQKPTEGIAKADIGKPFNFKHVEHVGSGPKRVLELENVDESLSQSFKNIDIGKPFNFKHVLHVNSGPKRVLEVENDDESPSQSFEKTDNAKPFNFKHVLHVVSDPKRILEVENVDESPSQSFTVYCPPSSSTLQKLSPMSFNISPNGNSSAVSDDLRSALIKGFQSGGINLKPVGMASKTKRRNNAGPPDGIDRDLWQALAVRKKALESDFPDSGDIGGDL